MRVVPATATRLIGRDDGLGRLTALLERAAEGHPAVALVSGETGVGKTALVRELVATTEVVPFIGRVRPVAGEALPYAAAVPGPALLARLGLGDRVSPSPGADPAVLRDRPARLVGGAAASDQPVNQFGSSTRCSPCCVGWAGHGPSSTSSRTCIGADRSTLDLLRFLASNLDVERVLVVATYRSDDPVDASAVRAGWPRSGRLAVGRADPARPADCRRDRALVDRLTGGAATKEARESTWRAQRATPCSSSTSSRRWRRRDGLPSTLRELLQVRVARHSGETRGCSGLRRWSVG